MEFKSQIVIIFAATNGFLDNIPVSAVKRFEEEYLKHLEVKHPEVLSEIVEKGKLEDELKEKMKNILQKFVEVFRYEGE